MPIEDDWKQLLMVGAHFVVGTVGRVGQLVEMGALGVGGLRCVVFD
jgi:superfamily II DNA/RNA helicase